jgi:ribosomal protein S18 acetylase RimI-like enzyme
MHHATLIGRRAEEKDIPAIRAMQERSIRVLGADFYVRADLEAFLAAFSTMDDAVVTEGHYFVLVTPGGRIVASAGWSQARPSYARGGETFDARTATIRSVFVDPEMPRQGYGREVMRITEADAFAAGIRRLVVSATLSGLSFYRAIGYRDLEHRSISLGDNVFDLVRMEKPLTRAAIRAA